MAKGSAYEREICRQLSLWWTQDLEEPRDDLFWRTSNSGGRATARGKKNKTTKGQYGDVCATDPIGQPLIDFFTIEIKRGYNKDTIQDLLDKRPKSAKQRYETWFEKVERDYKASGSKSWMLIVRRDQRIPLVFMPLIPRLTLEVEADFYINPSDELGGYHIVCCTLENFLYDVTPQQIKRLIQ